MAYFIFTVIAAIGAELIQDGFLVFLARLAITSSNRFQIFTPGTLYHIKVSFSVTFNMAQRYFSEYLSVTFNSAQFVATMKIDFLPAAAINKSGRGGAV